MAFNRRHLYPTLYNFIMLMVMLFNLHRVKTSISTAEQMGVIITDEQLQNTQVLHSLIGQAHLNTIYGKMIVAQQKSIYILESNNMTPLQAKELRNYADEIDSCIWALKQNY